MKRKITGRWIGEKDIKKNTEVVILIHEGVSPNFLAFDIFVRKGIKRKKPKLYKWLKKHSDDYTVDCTIAESFAERHKSFEYVFSQDLAHITYFNVAVLLTLFKIYKKFRTAVVLFEETKGDENEKKE